MILVCDRILVLLVLSITKKNFLTFLRELIILQYAFIVYVMSRTPCELLV